MAIDRKELISTFKNECNKIDSLSPGYNQELFEAVTDIILAEYNHKERATNIQQKVNDVVDRLAKQIVRNQKA
jgi:hypothetical protein|tara:strand:+ start:359 stop:577 length:219 start_codon:yes stop_codon:yes gene_type:complete